MEIKSNLVTEEKIKPGYTIPCLDHGFVRYIDHLGSDLRIVEAARISYQSPSKGEEQDKKLLSFLYKSRHTSPFEQCSITFDIKLPIMVFRQMVRHRTARLNEVSARYTQLPNEFDLPKLWRVQDTKNKQGSVLEEKTPQWHLDQFNRAMSVCDIAYKVYEEMLADGVAKEMARMVLPINIYTEVYWNMDLHNLLHFIRLREDTHAQAEIQIFGNALKQITQELFPWSVAAYEKYKFQLVET